MLPLVEDENGCTFSWNKREVWVAFARTLGCHVRSMSPVHRVRARCFVVRSCQLGCIIGKWNGLFLKSRSCTLYAPTASLVKCSTLCHRFLPSVAGVVLLADPENRLCVAGYLIIRLSISSSYSLASSKCAHRRYSSLSPMASQCGVSLVQSETPSGCEYTRLEYDRQSTHNARVERRERVHLKAHWPTI